MFHVERNLLQGEHFIIDTNFAYSEKFDRYFKVIFIFKSFITKLFNSTFSQLRDIFIDLKHIDVQKTFNNRPMFSYIFICIHSRVR